MQYQLILNYIQNIMPGMGVQIGAENLKVLVSESMEAKVNIMI